MGPSSLIWLIVLPPFCLRPLVTISQESFLSSSQVVQLGKTPGSSEEIKGSLKQVVELSNIPIAIIAAYMT